MAQKNVYYSKKYIAREEGRAAAAAGTKQATRRTGRVGVGILAAGLLVALLLVLVVPALANTGGVSGGGRAAAGVASPRHMVTYNSPAEACAAAGIAAVVPQWLPEGTQLAACSVVDGAVLELSYKSGDTVWQFRASASKDNLCGVDIRNCAHMTTETVDDVARTYAGATASRPSYAAWSVGGVNYAVVAESGMEMVQMRSIAESVA